MKHIDENGRTDPGWIIATGIACCVAVLAVLVAAMFAVVLLSTQANAQSVCAPWPTMKEQFADKYHEIPVSTGQVSPTVVLVILASPDGETWSAVVVNVSGFGCILNVGRNWEPGENSVKGEGRG